MRERSSLSVAGTTFLVIAALSGCSGAQDEVTCADEGAATKEAPPDAPPPKPGHVSFATAKTERAYGVGIEDKAHQKPKVIYSVRVKDLGPKEELRLRGEVTLSRCNDKDVAGLSGDAKTTPCASSDMRRNAYDYAPRFSATFVLASSANDASGMQLGGWHDTVCSEEEHHCALVLPALAAKNLPTKDAYVNLVVSADADGHGAHSWDVMEVEQGHGALAVTRMAPGAQSHAITEETKTPLVNGSMGIDQTPDEGDDTKGRHVLYRARVDGLEPGDVVDASAKLQAVLGGGFTCDPLITSEVFISADKDAKEPSGASDAWLGAKNGHNCSDHSASGCTYEKSVAVRLGGQAAPTMYVIWVATAARSCAAPNGGNTWHLAAKDGVLSVNVRR
ncbi:hypothetical protein BH09MYX1_BH09MYX1_46960 [soil metagenome]